MTDPQPPGPDDRAEDAGWFDSADANGHGANGNFRRELIPSMREVQAGIHATEDSGPPVNAVKERRPLKQTLAAFLSDIDPRKIEGPKSVLLILALVGFVGDWDDKAIGLLLPEIQAEFALNLQFLLGLGATLGIIGTITSLPLGYIADRVPRVWMVRIAATGGGIASAGQALAPGVSQLVGARAVGGLVSSAAKPAMFPLLTDYFPSRSRARVFAFFAAVGSLGGILGPFIAGKLADTVGWRSAILLLGLLSVLVALLTFKLREPTRGYWDRREMGAGEEVASTEQDAVGFAEGFRAAWSIVTLRRICYAMPFMTIGGTGLALVLTLYYAQVFQLTPGQRGAIASLASGVGLLGLVFSGHIADRLLRIRPGRVVVLMAMLIIGQAGAFVLMAITNNLWLAIAIEIPIAFVGAMIEPAMATLLSLVVPARVRGLGLQTLAPWRLPALLFLPLIGGYMQMIGLRRGMLLLAPLLVIGALILMSASAGVERDIRAAFAASMADEAARQSRAAGRNKMLVCRDVEVQYSGVRVVHGVDFDVEEGDIVALLGTNGAGKSSLLRAISGIHEATNGAIFLDGRDITHMPPYLNVRNGVVMMPGGRAVFPSLSVMENLRAAQWVDDDKEDAGADAAGDEPSIGQPNSDQPTIDDVLQIFPALSSRLAEPAGNLSGGEQQMVGLAQAFLMRPRLLMIDELSLGLAPPVVSQLLGVLRDIHASGTTVIIVEQSINVALSIADRAVFMDKGEIRFDGRTEELLARPDLIRSVFMGGGISAGSVMHRRARPDDVATDAALEVDAVHKAFGGVQALTSASLEVRPGEIVGVIGPNGAGKTTLFDVISGFVPPDGGDVRLAGQSVAAMSPDARARMGLVRSFQNAQLVGSLTVRENIVVALDRQARRNPLEAAVWSPTLRKSERRLFRRADGLVELLGLEAYADKFVSELSTGSRRAVDVACIFAAEPAVLLLDEPASGLAQAEVEELGPVLVRVVRELGCGLLIIEHDLPMITSISDRLVAMDLGRTLLQGTPSDVVAHPEVLRSYLAATEDVVVRRRGRHR